MRSRRGQRAHKPAHVANRVEGVALGIVQHRRRDVHYAEVAHDLAAMPLRLEFKLVEYVIVGLPR
jgi:hypothetical protein